MSGELRRKAACRDMGTEQFFPATDSQAAEAIRVCVRCPVREMCGREADDMGDRYGIRAGFRMWLESDRDKLREYLGRPPRLKRGRACRSCGVAFETRSRRLLCPSCCGLVPAEGPREKVRAMQRAGLTNPEIAELTGVKHGSLNGLLYGKVDGKAVAHIAKDAAERIMAAPIPQRVAP
ncbi:WhiB family transcriptional regulator [Nocardia abscessus]|uniref:WhiB family transcriptional regulator n=1 Tax=Nocardia abscessus TaxID=120957 RepID=UPI0002DA7A2A|nr:WhiB family transcriptional regulator [Nocardia abscessus]MCC3333539.1 WhiB family transcriptional regulator [Nocardia abscessus]